MTRRMGAIGLPEDSGASCIFCGRSAVGAPREHIWPESLGGDDEMLLSEGKQCGQCNNYFGRKVEAPALRSWPFDLIRAFGSIPSKKGRWAGAEAVGGTVMGGARGPELVPRLPGFVRRMERRQTFSLTFLAEPTAPAAVCRLLLKMGLQLISETGIDVASSSRFRAARTFARAPSRGAKWWFAVDGSQWAAFLRRELPPDEPITEVWTTLLEEADNADMVAVKTHGIVLFAPLVPWLVLTPDHGETSEPVRYFRVSL